MAVKASAAAPAYSFVLSPSVQRVVSGAAEREAVTSWEVVASMLRDHPEYGGRQGTVVQSLPGPEGGPRLAVDEWLSSLDRLYDPEAVPELHGRLLVLGLSRVDPDLGAYLQAEAPGFLRDLYQEIRERPFEVLLRGGGVATPFLAGYASDVARGADRLGVQREVENIALVLLSKDVQPPLSLGLFGDWGSGKSFFMGKLAAQIDTWAEAHAHTEAESGTASAWCTRVVQIPFNAWHFADANLWASLVTEIYAALFGALQSAPSDRDLRARLIQEALSAEGDLRLAQTTHAAAQADVRRASERLQEARASLAAEKVRAVDVARDLGVLLADDPALRAELEEKAALLGVPNAAQSYDDLAALHTDLRSFRTRTAALLTAALGSPTRVLTLLVLIVAVPGIVTFVLFWLQAETATDWISEAGEIVLTLAALVGTVTAWVGRQVHRGSALIGKVDESFQKARRRYEAQIEAAPQVRAAQAALTEAADREARAQRVLGEAETKLESALDNVEEARPERQLTRLIGDRGEAETYSRHLGIVSHIREDFESISRLLVDWADADREADAPLPIQRIILYIDDLDRCRPEVVVKVLEAVHLLLAFPLFVVVVGVDPRWLRHALATHYPHTLKVEGTDAGVLATPQDYLEKIFQIPFTLRPVEQDGYEAMVRSLLGDGRPAGDGASGAVEVRGGEGTASGNGQAPETPAASDTEAAPVAPPSPEQIRLTPWEVRDVERLGPLFRTPRTIKRFANTYRLLRASLTPGPEVEAFEGTAEAPGEYQTALVLLAIVTGVSRDAEDLIEAVGAAFSPSTPETTWSNALDIALPPNPTSPPSQAARSLRDAVSSLDRRFGADEYRRWVARVARYSYSVRPALA